MKILFFLQEVEYVQNENSFYYCYQEVVQIKIIDGVVNVKYGCQLVVDYCIDYFENIGQEKFIIIMFWYDQFGDNVGYQVKNNSGNNFYVQVFVLMNWM